MMEFGVCPRCKRYQINPQTCGCQSFTAWLSEFDESDGNHVFAIDAEDAAERYCNHYDTSTAEYSIVQDGHAEVTVRNNQTGKIQKFDIEARTEPVYNASWKEDVEEEEVSDG